MAETLNPAVRSPHFEAEMVWFCTGGSLQRWRKPFRLGILTQPLGITWPSLSRGWDLVLTISCQKWWIKGKTNFSKPRKKSSDNPKPRKTYQKTLTSISKNVIQTYPNQKKLIPSWSMSCSRYWRPGIPRASWWSFEQGRGYQLAEENGVCVKQSEPWIWIPWSWDIMGWRNGMKKWDDFNIFLSHFTTPNGDLRWCPGHSSQFAFHRMPKPWNQLQRRKAASAGTVQFKQFMAVRASFRMITFLQCFHIHILVGIVPLPKMLRCWGFFLLLISKTLKHEQLPKMLRPVFFYTFHSKSLKHEAFWHFWTTGLARWLRTRHFSECTFRCPGTTDLWKNAAYRDLSTFSLTWIFFLLWLSLSLSISLPLSSDLLSSDSLFFWSSYFWLSSSDWLRWPAFIFQ